MLLVLACVHAGMQAPMGTASTTPTTAAPCFRCTKTSSAGVRGAGQSRARQGGMGRV